MMNVLRKTKGVLSVLLLLVLLFTGCNAGGTVTPGSTETTDTVDVDGTTVTTFEGTGDNTTDTVKSDPPSAPETTNEPTKPTLPSDDADGKFSIAIIPDTQQEVITHAVKYEYFKKRSDWLVANKDKYDLRYVVHTGDVVNWGDADESQLVIASDAMKILDDAGIRSILSLGNHDTAAVGVGGGAADPNNTKTRVRDTTAFNKYFSTTRYPYLNVKDSGKVDNSYVTFEAGGAKWLILSIELWPRTEVVDWANTVVKNHPDYNVLVSTHSYMNSDGSISTSNGGYGANSPKYLYDNLIQKYSNIKMVFCGHVGQSKTRVDTGVNGNKIVSVLGCFHANNQNPVRILEIDVNAGTVKGTLHESVGTTDYSNYNFTQSGMNFIK